MSDNVQAKGKLILCQIYGTFLESDLTLTKLFWFHRKLPWFSTGRTDYCNSLLIRIFRSDLYQQHAARTSLEVEQLKV